MNDMDINKAQLSLYGQLHVYPSTKICDCDQVEPLQKLYQMAKDGRIPEYIGEICEKLIELEIRLGIIERNTKPEDCIRETSSR